MGHCSKEYTSTKMMYFFHMVDWIYLFRPGLLNRHTIQATVIRASSEFSKVVA